ncbi:hypothetical protein KAT60_02085 [Candidatus Woesebacteria bacterium]|nr:hypothetical protein [Candidatus Woesebacteria bacterium]
MRNLIAQKQIDLGESLRGIGPLGLEDKRAWEGGLIFNQFISSAIGLMTVIATIWLTFLIIAGAYGIMSAGGDKAQLEAARKRLSSGVVGFVVVIMAVFIIRFIGSLLGLEDILNPAYLIDVISPK